MKKLLTGIVLMILSLNLSADPRRIIYKGEPIKITLGVNAEQRITFSDTKLLYGDIKNSLKERLTTQIVNNNVYWTATDSFKNTRITIGEEGTGKIYLLDIMASQNRVNNKRIVVVDGEDPYSISAKDKVKEPEKVISALQNKRTPIAGFTTMLRFAAREVYAPERLRMKNLGIHKEFVNTKPVYHLLRENSFATKPIAAWRSGALHVTAISVVNKTGSKLSTDPRTVRGAWKSILFFNNSLDASGSPRDNTTLFLISGEPFADAIRSNVMIKVGRR